ncbi:MAG: DUF4242 domain-containing protein [Planctomycetes bacterium]|nr:DUF4242 domain-containing protein [Planctomycetota bacterium]MCB9905188.1 DUF4242 domain-containing protein [Planctomycetota bacterium]
MSTLIVERTFDAPLSDESLAAVMERLGPCLEEYGVTWVRSFLSADRCRMLCHYEAPDAEAVRASNRAAEAIFDSVWPATLLSAD